MPFLNLDGQSFLGVYMLLLVGAAGAALAIVRLVRAAGQAWPGDVRDFPPSDVAYLSEGPDVAAAAALSSLVSQSLVRYDAKSLQLMSDGSTGAGVDDFEAAVHRSLMGRPTIPSVLRDRLKGELDGIRARLTEAGLLQVPEARLLSGVAAVAPMLLVLSLGFAKMFAGVERDRSVGFLLILVVIGVVVLVCTIGAVPRRTRAGDAVLDSLRQAHAALEVAARSRGSALAPRDLSMAVGLFGVTVLQWTQWAGLGLMLTPVSSSAGSMSSGSSCGSGGGGDGGCGGGCGGCSD